MAENDQVENKGSKVAEPLPSEMTRESSPSAAEGATPQSIEEFYDKWPEIGSIPIALKKAIFRFAESWRQAGVAAKVETPPVCVNCGSSDTSFRLCEKCWSDAEFPARETAQPASEEEERKAFEAWLKDFGPAFDLEPADPDCGTYAALDTEDMWKAWLARSRRKTEARHGQ